MVEVVQTGALLGVDGLPVLVEVDLLRRLPSVVVVGLASGAVREASERVRSAIQSVGHDFPRKRVVVNLAPADLPKSGTAFDLPIALGILAADGQIATEALAGVFVVGELALDGQLRPIRGGLSLALCARGLGCRALVLPAQNAAEAAWIEGIDVFGASSLEQVVDHLQGDRPMAPTVPQNPTRLVQRGFDLADVRGQHRVRRALEVAAAGGHNLLMIGPPGCGKTMLAARLPSILPDLDLSEAIDITRIHSVAGLLPLGSGLVFQRPFRAPHHTITVSGMVGNARLMPGEVSLAHHGVLFLDELPEFQRNVLEVLRGPLEDRVVRLTRARGSVSFPAGVSLVAAANPCPCGFLGHPTRPCTCMPSARDRYQSRLSGPLLDRFDMHVWVQPVGSEALVEGPPGETSEAVRSRVLAARNLQTKRHPEGRHNAALAGEDVRRWVQMSSRASSILQRIIDRHELSARAWSRIVKVSRTIADLDQALVVDVPHVLEAASYREQAPEGHAPPSQQRSIHVG